MCWRSKHIYFPRLFSLSRSESKYQVSETEIALKPNPNPTWYISSTEIQNPGFDSGVRLEDQGDVASQSWFCALMYNLAFEYSVWCCSM